jgi:hypothetical protein
MKTCDGSRAVLDSSDHRACPPRRDLEFACTIPPRRLAIVAGLATLGLWLLPRPVHFVSCFVLPPVYLAIRAYPGLRGPVRLLACLAWAGLSFAPAWITSDPADLDLALATLLLTAPVVARVLTWYDASGRWDALDPLVIACTPCALARAGGVIARLFQVGVFAWD